MAETVGEEDLPRILEALRAMYDYVVIDIDKRLDETNLPVLELADAVFVVMTADLSCLKNVRLVLETISHLGYADEKIHLLLNRSTAFTGINVKHAENALRRQIEHQVVNDYRGAISALNSGAPFMMTKSDSLIGRSVLDLARHLENRQPELVYRPRLAFSVSAARS